MGLRDVNLIAEDEISTRHAVRHVVFWTCGLIVITSLLGAFYLAYGQALKAQRRAIAENSDKPGLLQARIAQIQAVRAEIDRIGLQQSALESAVRNKRPYSLLVERLAGAMNDRTWLAQLAIESARAPDAEAAIRVSGFSFTNSDLGDFLHRLSSDPLFRRVELRLSSEGAAAGDSRAFPAGRFVQFQLEGRISK
ncbi:MAG: PilN domain-containing protein [Syntrophales bacterium]|jgi:Tfp pilus assembly protein PilN|nr:PilN domain-containing protein [Syntrophales bacterium]MDD5232945.1 PilN domain-containing protein [Syntrophales bacterium]